MVKIKAVRAINDPVVCQKYVDGHSRVLSSIGVTKVTSMNVDWMYNPAAFVILVESADGERVLGGARIHAVGGNQRLPIVDATIDMDPEILPLVHNYGSRGSGELCGLWNSREVAGMGIGAIFVSRAAMAILTQIKLTSLFVLCAPYTIQMGNEMGFDVETSIGNNGTFYYPKEDLLATVMLHKDTLHLPKATQEERDRVFDLRARPQQKAIEIFRNKEVGIAYDLQIPDIEEIDFTYNL